METDTVTTDLSRFGYREKHILIKLLQAEQEQGTPDEMGNGITPHFNTRSGYVFLCDEDYNVCMINPDTGKLEMFYNTPYEGREGFYSDLKDEYDEMHPEDKAFMDDIKRIKDESI